MKCTHCHMNEANTHIQRIINGQKEEMYLCEDCARELGVMNDFSFEPFSADSFFGDSFFGNLLGAGASAFNSLVGLNSCATCGSTLNDIVNSGHVGCSDCYDKFDDRLTPSIEKIHGNVKHIGKNVTYTEATNTEKKTANDTLAQLKEELKQAVKEQRFEDAATLRDKIKELNKEN